MGIAYGFFNCRRPKENIENALPDVRGLAELPANLDILVEELESWRPGDARLQPIVEQQTKKGRRYVMRVRDPSSKNEQAAFYVTQVFDHLMYQRQLYDASEPFGSDILFETRGEFTAYDEGL